MNYIRKITALLCTVAMILSGIAMAPAEAKATDSDTGIYTEIVYDNTNYSISDYWTTESKTAPTKSGYVFGGWYTKPSNTYIALEKDDITTDSEGKASMSETVYAKFVPAQVLSVKAQNASGTKANDGKAASVRVISAVDSTAYQNVGFTILINNKNKLLTETEGELESAQIYTGLKVGDDSYSAADIFGVPAEYLNVWRLDGILDKRDTTIINVTPYWTTLDGTKVEGQCKYIHIEDGYEGYISVPVNINTTENIAAGTVTITYPEGLTLVEDKVEFAGVLPEATLSDDKGSNTITIVGNATEADVYDTYSTGVNNTGIRKTILVNLRFTADTSAYPGAGKGTFLQFIVADENALFYNWGENKVTVNVCNVQY